MSTMPMTLSYAFALGNVPVKSSYSLVRQRCGAKFHRLFIQQPLLILVRRGRKEVVVNSIAVHGEPTGVIVLSAGEYADVSNLPDSDGVYEADVFAFSEDACLRAGTPPTFMARFGSFQPSGEFYRCVTLAQHSLSGTVSLPDIIKHHRVAELILWCRTHGINVAFSRPENLLEQVRQIISNDPGRRWKVSEIAARLRMSEPTLRRHLGASGTSATKIISDIRLTRALEQLQTSPTSIMQIALDAGYDSPSRFAARFRARFGVSPGEIRGKKSAHDRNRAKVDHIGLDLVSTNLDDELVR